MTPLEALSSYAQEMSRVIGIGPDVVYDTIFGGPIIWAEVKPIETKTNG